MSGSDKPRWQVPDEDPATRKIGKRKHVAGGLPAIVSSTRHLLDQTGIQRGVAAVRRLNQKDGFDCPGCAWPDPDGKRSLSEFCENGVKAVAAEATRKRIGRDFFAEHSLDNLAAQSDHWLEQQGRLTEPMLLEAGATHYRLVGWDEAIATLATELRELEDPNQALFYTSGRTSNEAAFLYQLMVRLYGTNNLPDCSNMCHESSGVAMKETLGIGKGTVTLEDFNRADCIFVVGQNPGTNHPRMLSALQEARRGGCEIITINPLPEAGTERFVHPQEPWNWAGKGTGLTTQFLQVRINGDVAVFQALMKEMLEREARCPGSVLDQDFIEEHTSGFDALRENLQTADWGQLLQSCGLDRDEIKRCVDTVLRSKRIICCWAMGLTQHVNAVANIQEIVNFLLLRGNVGRPGAGPCPVRGHSNVQGDRTMGIWEKPSGEWLDRLGGVFGFDPPREHGHDVVEGIRAMADGRARFFLGLGGNFLSATPDTAYTAAALQRCSLTAHVSTKLNRSHLVTGQRALILPCLGRTERDLQASGLQFVSVEDSMGVVHASRGRLTPAAPGLKSEVDIVCSLAAALFGPGGQAPETATAAASGPLESPGTRVDWAALAADYDRIRDLIEQSIPGFEHYNARVRSDGGFYLPNPVRDERRFVTDGGLARFTCHAVPAEELAEDEVMMMTIRSHDQYNTTVYGLADRYRGISSGRRVVFLNQQDMADRGLAEGDLVDLTHGSGSELRRAAGFAVVRYEIPPRCAATYFPEANVLVPIGRTAKKSNTPASKSVPIRVHRR